MDNLFIKTSKILRDNWIVELQKDNDFLKNKLSNINLNPFFGHKVNIKEHAFGMGTNFISKTPGIIYNIDKVLFSEIYHFTNMRVVFENCAGPSIFLCKD